MGPPVEGTTPLLLLVGVAWSPAPLGTIIFGKMAEDEVTFKRLLGGLPSAVGGV
jgi:hypothetical protein